MRDDMVAAYFDFDDVAAFHKAMLRGEVPRPTDTRFRGGGKTREPIWALEACRMFIFRRHGLDPKDDGDNLLALIWSSTICPTGHTIPPFQESSCPTQ